MQSKPNRHLELISDIFSKELKSEIVDKSWDTSIANAISDYLLKNNDGNWGNLRYLLALACFTGFGLLNDQKKGLGLLRQGILMNHEKSMFALGVIYFYGIGVKKNIVKGIKLISEAAHKNHADAQYYMGLICIEIMGDYDSAARWMNKASENEHAEASYLLGRMCENHEFEDEDLYDIVDLYEKAVLQGHTEALKDLLRYKDEH